MEDHLGTKKNARDRQSTSSVSSPSSPKSRQSTKLRDRLRLDKHDWSYADLHPVVTKIVDSIPSSSSGFDKKNQISKNVNENDELVKYMSNLPSYLERGNIQEKAFNVGVLDWRRLEKWQHNQKQAPNRSRRCSLSSNNSSSIFSTEGSSSHSSRGLSCSPSRQGMHQTTLQSHMNASPTDGCPEGVKPLVGSVEMFPGLDAASRNHLKGQKSVLRTCQSANKNPSGNGLKECKSKDSDPRSIPQTQEFQNFNYYGVASSSKGKMKIPDGDSKGLEKLQVQGHNVDDHDWPEQHKTVVLLLPRDGPQNKCSAISIPSDSTENNGRRSMEISRRSFSDGSILNKDSHTELYSDIPHSCHLPCEVDSIRHSQIEPPTFISLKSNKLSLEPSQPSMCSAKFCVSPSRGKALEGKFPVMPINSTVTKSSEGLEPKRGTVTPVRVRNPSPTHRFNIGMGRIGGSSSSGDSSAIPQLSSKHVATKSGSQRDEASACLVDKNCDKSNATSRGQSSPLRRLLEPFKSGSRREEASTCSSDKTNDKSNASSRGQSSPLRRLLEPFKSASERDEASACLNEKTCDNANATSRGQSSPLRRLLDPLLKLKAANQHQSAGPSQNDSALTEGTCKSSDGRSPSSTVHAIKTKLDLRSCRSIEIDELQNNEIHGSPTVQALLQVAVKNGLPLFTFAVDNNTDILAATMRKLTSSRKNDNSWIYTFFTIREMKKKNGRWLNQAAKGKGHGYVPNVVAQMKASDPPFSDAMRQKCGDQFSVREFVLFSVDLKQTDQQISDLQPNDELAAIIIKFPRKTTEDLISSGQQCKPFNNQTVTGLRESLPDVRGDPNSYDEEEKEKEPSVESQDLVSTTVILPGGDHGVPSKGEPSPLIERWKSGGSCDCGGWDLGCRLRVLVNQTQFSTKSSPTKDHLNAERFELFSQQEEVLDNMSVFSLSTFKDGIFSVEFNSSVSLLQAFSICIAVLNSRKPSELSVLRNLFEEKYSEETTLAENDGITASERGVQMEIPANCASYPPLFPVGRV
ncbi:unnamed protein product [Ilex paraguariensis]|uniref:Uncharacterized protein n=1 Tax=Ilex paraguariensis TaxID=185542 RepID=A0ABC8V3I2_9AQUA